jgi:hypothetical protein
MSHYVEISPSKAVGWQGLAEALAASGVHGMLVETSPELRLSVDGCTAGDVASALERWLVERDGSLLPQVVSEELIVLRPPAA